METTILFLPACGLNSKDAKIQSATLLHVIGPAAWENDDDKQKVEMILSSLYSTGKCWKRHMFNTCNQHDDEMIDQYVTDFNKHANFMTLQAA